MTDTMVALITTTINKPTVLEKYVNDWKETHDDDLILVVAGDVQTPTEVEAYVEVVLDGTYLGTRVPKWRTDGAVGLRSIQRRNLALLHAISIGAEVIITIDDDNDPCDGYVDRMLTELRNRPDHVWHVEDGWFNPGILLDPPTWARGFPIDERRVLDGFGTQRASDGGQVAVVNGLTTGDPDIDAFERLANRPYAKHVNVDDNVVLAHGTWAPINTQNTGFVTDVAPLFQVLNGVGRYDDILMSYVARAVLDSFNLYVSYGHPSTHSVRNDHNIVKDLEKEIFGYYITSEFCARLREVQFVGGVVERLADAYAAVWDLLPEHTKRGNDAWLQDVTVGMTEAGR